MRLLRDSFRFFLVSAGVILLTSIGIDATQFMDGSGSALSILTREALTDSCRDGTVEISTATGAVCIDKYEAVPEGNCPHLEPKSVADTAANLNDKSCVPASVAGEMPWRHVTYHQAEALCAKAGKRLLTNQDWYRAALGTPDSHSTCNTNGSLQVTGQYKNCISGVVMHDAIGNVWEWVDSKVENGIFEEQMLPVSGYVANANLTGIASVTSFDPQVGFNADYFWSDENGDYVMMRGGFYGSGEDAGLFSIHADMATNFSGEAIGFRCAYSLK